MTHLREENSRLLAALVRTEQGIKQETIQWEEERSNLMQSINEQQQAGEITRNQSNEGMRIQMRNGDRKNN